MKYSLLIFIASLFSSFCHGQDLHVVTLQERGDWKQLLNMTASEKNVLSLLAASRFYSTDEASDKRADSAMQLANKALEFASSLKFREGIASAHLQLAKVYQLKKNYPAGVGYAMKAIQGFTELNKPDQLGEAYVLKWSNVTLTGADIVQRVGLLDSASDCFKHANNKIREADCYKELADIYQLDNKGIRALALLQNALVLYKAAGYERLQGVYDLLCGVYIMNGDYENGVHHGLLAIQTAEKLGDTSIALCTYYNRLGGGYNELKDTARSRLYFAKSLAIAMKYNDLPSITTLVLNTADVLQQQSDYKGALLFLKNMSNKYPELVTSQRFVFSVLMFTTLQGLKRYNDAMPYLHFVEEQVKELDKKPRLKMFGESALINFYLESGQLKNAASLAADYKKTEESYGRMLYTTDYLLTQFKVDSANRDYIAAIRNFQRYKSIKDSLFNEAKSSQMEQYAALYETEKKEKDIAMLKKESEAQQQQIKQSNTIQRLTLAAAMLFLVIAAMAAYGYRLKQRTNKSLLQYQGEIHDKNEKLENLVEEKDWLVREIHHRVKNNLQMVAGLLSSQTEYVQGDEAVKVITESQQRVEAMSILHQKLYQTESLSAIDMNSYISDLIEYLGSCFDTGKPVSFRQVVDSVAFPLSHSVPIGLIINEAVTNSMKYAFTGRTHGSILIELHQTDKQSFELSIKDDGNGIPSEMINGKTNSLGLSLIRGLSQDIRGTLNITNASGTQIAITFPSPLTQPG